MRWLLNALSTSVGRKVVLAITGLLLCGFLVAHLAGNLLMHAGDDGKSYNEYAHALHKQAALLVVAEIGLFGLFIAHIVIALQVSKENRAARKVGYAVTRSKQEGRIAMEGYRPDTWMLVTGIVVLGFLILHLIDFKFGTELKLRDQTLYFDGTDEKSPYDKAVALLKTPLTIIGYGIGCVFLAFHLAHAFQSAFQTLGFNHPKYTPTIKTTGLIFALVIGVGFVSFPVSGLIQSGTSSSRPKASVSVPADRQLEPVPTPPPGTLEGVDDPSSLRPVNFEQELEHRIQKAPRELRPSKTPLQKAIEDK